MAFLFARITVNGETREISLKQKIHSFDWDSKKEQLRNKTPEAQRLNSFIEKVRFLITEKYRDLIDQGEPFTVDNVKDLYFSGQVRKHSSHSLLELFSYHNEHNESILAHGTMKNYYTTLAYLNKFISKYYGTDDLPLSKIDYSFIERFERFVRTEPIKSYDPCRGNGVYKHMERLSKVLTIGRKLRWMKENPFMDYTKHMVKPQRKFLDITELERIEQQIFYDPKINYVKDLFLFSCYTGLAYVDVSQLRPADFYRSNDGKLWMDKYRQKSKELSAVPLLDNAIAVIERYWNGSVVDTDKTIFPFISNQEVNRNLKIIRAACGISKEVTFHIARHTFATTVTLKNGVPIETVSKMLGHTKLSTTQIYAKVDEDKIANDMNLAQLKLNERKIKIS